MKKIYFTVVALGLSATLTVSAQLAITDLNQEVQFGKITAVDVDGDGDLDIIAGGQTGPGNAIVLSSQLYINNGNGVFTASASPFIQLARPTYDWGDINNDGRLDLITNGFPQSGGPVANIYTSNSSGVFSLSAIPGIPQLALPAALPI